MAEQNTLEERLRAIEDRLAIYNLIASHPPSADSGAAFFARAAYTEDAVVDLAAGKTASGREAIAAMLDVPGHREAIDGGLAHFCGLPRIDINGDTAFVTSYLQILAPDPNGPPVAVPNHGISKGFRIHRIGVNRWELARSADGWRIARRTLRSLDGSPPAQDLLRGALIAFEGA